LTTMQREEKLPFSQEVLPGWLQGDLRWSLTQRVVAGAHFARSPLLSKFLLFVVAETLEGREGEITEQQIGVQVFDRLPGYRTAEDNIVRNYARQLRKRLAEHFAAEGSLEPLRIDMPVGGYVPVFVQVSETGIRQESQRLPAPASIETQSALAPPDRSEQGFARGRDWKGWLLRASLLATYSAALIFLTWTAQARFRTSHRPSGPADALWSEVFNGTADTYIVPADAGFNLLEDLSRHPLPLADYMKGGYLDLPLAGVDAHTAADMRSQEFTSFVDLQIVAALAGLPEYHPQRTFLRFPRELRLDDLKNANAVLIGSVDSNPWAAIAENSANFRIVYHQAMEGATIVNTHPERGEAASYASHWNEPAHETFALIAFLPNLDGSGHLLLLQGLDVAGTQAAAETLFHPAAIAPILRQATRPDGSLRFFEILLRATSLDSNSLGGQVIASRIY
jgi:hypothetical protein